jgi:hypothetical protein
VEQDEALAGGKSGVLILDDPADNALEPRWTGCPAGCGQYGHECGIGEPVVTSCHACGALSVAERDSLPDCSSVCPMRTVAS